MYDYSNDMVGFGPNRKGGKHTDFIHELCLQKQRFGRVLPFILGAIVITLLIADNFFYRAEQTDSKELQPLVVSSVESPEPVAITNRVSADQTENSSSHLLQKGNENGSVSEGNTPQITDNLSHQNLEENSSSSQIYVHVTGAVRNPDVYRLAPGQRIGDAVALAVPDDKANIHALNLAAPLQDGMKIIVPTAEEAEAYGQQYGQKSALIIESNASETADSPWLITGEEVSGKTNTTENSSKTGTDKVNINTAGLTELQTLPGIGAVKARAILDYRAQKGAFSAIEDLMNVEGIGTTVYGKLEPYIRV